MKKSMKAASLVEALVASIVFLIAFLIAMDSLVNIVRVRYPGVSSVDVELSVGECRERFAVDGMSKSAYEYKWGVIEFEAVRYKSSDDLSDVTVVVRMKNGRRIIYRYLVCNEMEN